MREAADDVSAHPVGTTAGGHTSDGFGSARRQSSAHRHLDTSELVAPFYRRALCGQETWLPADLVEMLLVWKPLQAATRLKAGSAWHHLGLIFTDTIGRPVGRENSNHQRWSSGHGEDADFARPARPSTEIVHLPQSHRPTQQSNTGHRR